MLKDLPKSQGNVQYIDVNPSSPFIKTDKVTVQPKSNKSKSDTSQSEKKDTIKTKVLMYQNQNKINYKHKKGG